MVDSISLFEFHTYKLTVNIEVTVFAEGLYDSFAFISLKPEYTARCFPMSCPDLTGKCDVWKMCGAAGVAGAWGSSRWGMDDLGEHMEMLTEYNVCQDNKGRQFVDVIVLTFISLQFNQDPFFFSLLPLPLLMIHKKELRLKMKTWSFSAGVCFIMPLLNTLLTVCRQR